MKTLKPILIGLAALTAVQAGADLPISYLANQIASNTQALVDTSYRVGDRGTALYDLEDMNRFARTFQYSLSSIDYRYLRSTYERARSSWYQLISYRYETTRYQMLTDDMETLIRQVESPGNPPAPRPPRPPAGGIVIVRAHGSGGTEEGNRDAACLSAQDRALQSITGQCSNLGGYLGRIATQACSCRHRSRAHIECNSSARGECEVRSY